MLRWLLEAIVHKKDIDMKFWIELFECLEHETGVSLNAAFEVKQSGCPEVEGGHGRKVESGKWKVGEEEEAEEEEKSGRGLA